MPDTKINTERSQALETAMMQIEKQFGKVDWIFGNTSGIIPYKKSVDKDINTDVDYHWDWKYMPALSDNYCNFSYWDPPYDKLYKKEGQEIWRCSRKLAILHIYIYPISWFKNAKRIGMIAVTMGPLKKIRCLQIFEKEVS